MWWHITRIRNYDIAGLICGEGNGTPLQYSCLENPWTEEPGGLQSMGLRKVGHNWATLLSLFNFMRWRKQWQPTPVVLPGESQGWGRLVGCCLWGRTESDTTEATYQQQQQQQGLFEQWKIAQLSKINECESFWMRWCRLSSPCSSLSTTRHEC